MPKAIDSFMFFCLSNSDKEFLGQYVSPSKEASTFKGVPVSELDRMKSLLRTLKFPYDIVYRGPRKRFRSQSRTWKQDATHFAVYYRIN